VHRLWLSITRESGMDKLHHSDIVTAALTRFAREYTGREREDLLKELRKYSGKQAGEGTRPRTAIARPPATPPPPLGDPSRPPRPNHPPTDPDAGKH
jgi:hypothetical protein